MKNRQTKKKWRGMNNSKKYVSQIESTPEELELIEALRNRTVTASDLYHRQNVGFDHEPVYSFSPIFVYNNTDQVTIVSTEVLERILLKLGELNIKKVKAKFPKELLTAGK